MFARVCASVTPKQETENRKHKRKKNRKHKKQETQEAENRKHKKQKKVTRNRKEETEKKQKRSRKQETQETETYPEVLPSRIFRRYSMMKAVPLLVISFFGYSIESENSSSERFRSCLI